MDVHRHGSTLDRDVVVLQSFPDPRPTTNPYIVMLGRSLRAEPGLTMLTFTWRRALLGRYDVFHVHWPEILVTGHTAPKQLVRQALFLLMLVRLAVRRTPVVRTVHNLDRPRGLSRLQVSLLERLDGRTVLRIVINGSTTLSPEQASVTILHGHYADWYAEHPLPSSERGRLGFFGLIRPYKGVGRLIDAFRALPGHDSLTLDIAGKPNSNELADDLLNRCGDDRRITLSFGYLSDAELVDRVGRAQLIVLPYTDARNSGGSLTALSLGRPVLVPDNVVNRTLRDEFGSDWVHLYSDELTPTNLADAVSAVDRTTARSAPDLSRRNWASVGERHLDAYRRAVDGTSG